MKFAKTFSATLSIVLLYITITEGMSLAKSASVLRCQCINLAKPEKPIKGMKSLEIIPSGPHCKNTEVIITLQSGSSVCMDPTTSWLQRIIKNQLERQNTEATQAPSA
ncbi:interleukin-8-like [Hyla sarda]|uniref:interleukin-8-like n=1 Tax=Hyla sarda TaxID=327740 RepID=UPI0024C365A7|nr:interleukin-8-like [Hyla sarda]